MIFKNSLKNLLRSKGKTALFFLLILITTVIQCLGISVWVSIDTFLDECNENYKTIGLIEYMGPEYPDDNIYDSRMNEVIAGFDFSLIYNNENVISWERYDKALGYIEGLKRKDINAPLKDHSVIIVEAVGRHSRTRGNSVVVKETLYSSEDFNEKMVFINDFGQLMEEDHYYLVNGTLGFGKTSYRYLSPMPFVSKTAAADGYTDSEAYMILDVTDGIASADPELVDVYEKIAQTYRVINNSVMIHATSDLDSDLQFHQEKLYVTEGRTFTAEEYENGDRVCIITDYIANDLGLEEGDIITLSMSVAEDTPVFESYWAGTGFDHEEEYEIVGICNTISEFTGNVYIPKTDDIDFSVNQIGYTVGTAVLDNDGADAFYNDISNLLPDRFRLTVYDQGYSAVADPLKKVLRIAIIISISSIVAGIAVIILFGFLFIYRQREVSDIMIKLGTGRKRTIGYFLYGSGLISLLAACAGAVTGLLFSNTAMEIVNRSINAFEHADRRFSISNLSITRETVWSSAIEPKVFITTGLLVLSGALLSCLVFTLLTFRNKNKKRKVTRKIRHRGHSVTFTGGPLKYTFISIFRSGKRSVIAPMAALGIILLISQLTSTVVRYERQLSDIYTDTVITGQFMDINGRYFNNLVVDGFILHDIYETGYLKEMHASRGMPAHYVGQPVIDGVDQELAPFELPEGFAGETMFDKIKMGPKIIFTNSISRAPEFYYTTEVRTEYMEGYDESFLTEELRDSEPIMCMVTTDFMEEHGVEFGDTIRLYIVAQHTFEFDFQIVGSYVKEGEKDNIYCQLAGYVSPELLTDSGDDLRERLYWATLHSASFVLKDPAQLNEFKEFMAEYGLSEANKLRTYRAFPVVDDKAFISMVESFNQKIRQTEVLYPFIYALTGVLAFLLAFILVLSRKREIAVMRGLGAKKGRVFISFFTEQLILSLTGGGLGLLLWLFASEGYNQLQLILAAGFVILYSLGSAAALIFINKSEVLAMLGEEE